MTEDQGKRARGRPKDQKKCRAILVAARELFLSEGLAEVSMETIAERADVSKATLYSHFADKNDLFRAVLAAETGDYEPEEERFSYQDLDELRAYLVQFGKALVAVLTRPGVLDLGRLLINESRRHPDQVADFFERGPRATHLRLARVLESASSKGLLKCHEPKLAADQLLSMWTGQQHVRQQLGLCAPPTNTKIDRHVKACVDVILKAYHP